MWMIFGETFCVKWGSTDRLGVLVMRVEMLTVPNGKVRGAKQLNVFAQTIKDKQKNLE